MRVALKIPVVLWTIVLVTCFGYVISRLLVFKQIFFNHAGIAITQPQVAEAKHDNATTQHIPKIIHHVFHNWKEPGNDALPSEWAATRQRCIDLNPDFEFKLWSENASRDLIENEYPWFLQTYDGYRYPVQRVDAIKYFLMQHYGGIYIDLDNGCNTDLTPLLYYPLWVTDGDRGTLSNNILGSRPQHPFWNQLTLALITYNWNWLLPFVTISYASGQWFETAIWEAYHALLPRPEENPQHEHRLYRVLMDGRPGADEWVFFSNAGGGGTWNNWDNRLFWNIGQHLYLFFAVLFSGLALVGWLGWRMYRRSRGRGGGGYARLENGPGSHVA